MTLMSRIPSIFLTAILTFGPLRAQTSTISNAPLSDTSNTQALRLRVVEGESTTASAGPRTLGQFVVEVTDSNGAAVPDAAVTLRLPDVEPTGRFPDGTHAAVAYTNQVGRAKLSAIRWNATPGTLAIRVT